MKIASINKINGNSRFNGPIGNSVNNFYLFENMTEGVCIVNEYGYIEYVNNTYEKVFNVKKKDMIGNSIFMVKCDDVLVTAFKEKQSIKGKLNYYFNDYQIEASASTIYFGEKFSGVITIYGQRKVDSRRKVIEIGKNEKTSSIYKYEPSNFFSEIIGESEAIKRSLYRAQKASRTSSTVLIRGESGTGKELVANAIHRNSKRANKPFITLNCGAIPSNLLESELFGHEQGAFTGAVKKKLGKFEQANGGTIFLDEIGDLPLQMQVKLLRVLQEKEFNRVGGNETIKVDVRIIAATNKNLEEMIDNDEFREDLYYRLNVIPIYLPSLKERKDDIPLLINHFVEKVSKKLGIESVKLTEEAQKCLCQYDWPGNVRELENIIERLIALCEGNTIDIYDIPKKISNTFAINKIQSHNKPVGLINMNEHGELATFEDYEREIIRYAIKKFKSFNAAGKALGITHKTVASKARKYNIVD